MTVKQSSPRAQKSLLTRLLVAAFMISFLGGLTLFVWTLWLWGTKGFDVASSAVARLSIHQIRVIEEFEDAHFTTWIRERLIPKLDKVSRPAMNQAGQTGEAPGRFVSRQTSSLGIDTDSINTEISDLWQESTHKMTQVWLLLKGASGVLALKLIVLLSALPLFLLAMTAGLVDGLNQRAIRTASLGRESTYVFHKSIPFAQKTMLAVLGLWLALPLNIAPSPVFVCLGVLLGIVVSMTASRFKKYL